VILFRSRFIAGLLSLALAGLVASAVGAQDKDGPKPAVKRLSALCVVAGRTLKLSLYGENLKPTAVKSLKAPLAVKLLESRDTPPEAKENGPREVIVEVTAPMDCPPDTYELEVVNEGGAAAKATLPVLAPVEKELEVKRPCSRRDDAMPLEGASVAVEGALLGDTADMFRFRARAGEKWRVELLAGRGGSELDPVLRLRDPRHISMRLTAGHPQKDRVIAFTAPADGEYILEVMDEQSRTGKSFRYRLTLRRQ
jgi:hypothetical protein